MASSNSDVREARDARRVRRATDRQDSRASQGAQQPRRPQSDQSPRGIRDLEDDLLYLRKGPGVTPARVASVGTLRLVLGGAQEPFASLRQRLVSAICSLPDEDEALLLDVFGLSPQAEGLSTLRQRQELHGTRIDRKVDTVAAREVSAIANLRNQLLSGWYPASPLGSSGAGPELHNGVVNEAVAITTVVADGQWQETREHYRFLALFDEADYLRIANSFPGTAVAQPPFTVRTQRIGSSWSHDFYHDGPMRRGQTYDLHYRLVPEAEVDAEAGADDHAARSDGNDAAGPAADSGTAAAKDSRLCETSRAFHERTLTARFDTVFLGTKPKTIWSFNRLSFFQRPGSLTPSTRLDLAGGSSVSVTYRDLYGGLFSGVGWEW